MNRYSVYVRYVIEDSVTVEAEDEYEAEKVALEERNLYAVSTSGYSVSWDDEEVVDIILEEEDVDE